MSTSEGHSVLPTTSEDGVLTVRIKTSKEDLNEGIELDPIDRPSHSPESITEGVTGEENDEIVPLAKPLTTDTPEKLTSQTSVTFDPESTKERDTVIARMTSTDSSAPSTPKSPLSKRSPGISRQISSALLRRDSNLSVQESWRKKSASVRLKSSNNFVSFHNICYTVPQGYFWQHKPPKVILNDVR